MTTFSPSTPGRTETRKSISTPSTVAWNLPSWGRRFSAMSMQLMIFTRDMIAARALRGIETLS
jgi:hypothetical protein